MISHADEPVSILENIGSIAKSEPPALAESEPPALEKIGKIQKPRNSEASKAGILEAAREAFSKKSYDEVGLREIASAAHIDPALIIRYFGSKEGLFREIIKEQHHTEGLAGVPQEDLPRVFAELIFNESEGTNQKGILLLYLSSTSETAGPIIRESTEERLIKSIAPLLPGENRELRVEMLMAILGGLLMARHITKPQRIEKAERAELIEMVTPLLRQIILEK